MKRYIPAILALMVVTGLLAGCTKTDTMLKSSRAAFISLISAHTAIVKDNTAEDHYYYLSVDGETTLKVSNDYNLTGSEDILLETPLKPFVDAGLDVSKLTSDYKVQDEKFYLIGDYGNGTGAKDTVADALFESVAFNRTMLTYHLNLDYCGISNRGTEKISFFDKLFGNSTQLEDPKGLDRFGIRLSQGGKFEYAKDYVKNDKDIVFMIAAKPLAQIGVDVRNVDGWFFTTMEDLDCNDTDVLLKTYDLK